MQHDRNDAVGVPQRKDMTDKKRMIAAVVPRNHFGGDRCVGVREHGRVGFVSVYRIDAFNRPAGEMTRSGIPARAKECSRRNCRLPGGRRDVRAFMPTEITHSGGSSEPDMNAFAVIPRTSPRTLRGDDGNAGHERGHDPAKQILGHRTVYVGIEQMPQLSLSNDRERDGTRQGRSPAPAGFSATACCRRLCPAP